ncbi:leucine-rich repeat protein, partial [Treponema sp. R8-4-B8]
MCIRDRTSITIPSSVTSIGIQAFVGCTAINSITSLKAAPPEIYSSINVSAFYSLDYASICLYVPESAVESYRAAFGWRDFSCVRPISALAALDHYYEGSGRDIPASIPA